MIFIVALEITTGLILINDFNQLDNISHNRVQIWATMKLGMTQ